jgi:hypothetical protein
MISYQDNESGLAEAGKELSKGIKPIEGGLGPMLMKASRDVCYTSAYCAMTRLELRIFPLAIAPKILQAYHKQLRGRWASRQRER